MRMATSEPEGDVALSITRSRPHWRSWLLVKQERLRRIIRRFRSWL